MEGSLGWSSSSELAGLLEEARLELGVFCWELPELEQLELELEALELLELELAAGLLSSSPTAWSAAASVRIYEIHPGAFSEPLPVPWLQQDFL